MKKLILLFFITGILFSSDLQTGEKIFKEKCKACHTIGEGRRVGPDLKDIHKKRDIEWLKKFIKKPSDLFGKNKIADSLLEEFKVKMPDLNLSDKEVEYVIFYIEEISEKEIKPREIKTGLKEKGFDKEKYERGKALFSGEILFKNKGTACISCHNVKEVFSFGGGKLGPDLTKAIENYGEEGLALALSDIPFPTMEPIYKNKPLEEKEIEDIVYFLKNLKKEKRENNLFVFALIGSIFLFFIPLLIWRKRNQGVRSNLLKGGK